MINTPPQKKKTAHFGYQRVDINQKQGLVDTVFSNVAGHYDLMNDLMSAGLHRLWKEELISALNPPKGQQDYKVIDMAGGTGDIAFRILRKAGGGTQTVLYDINKDMLEQARIRAEKDGLTERLKIIEGNAEELPFEDQYFDAYTIAFGIRNVAHLEKALKEARRVLKIGGRFLCLEFARVDIPLLDTLYETYSFTLIPLLGQIATGDQASYRYLVESIRKFPDQEHFQDIMEKAGFERVKYSNLSGGISALYSAWRL